MCIFTPISPIFGIYTVNKNSDSGSYTLTKSSDVWSYTVNEKFTWCSWMVTKWTDCKSASSSGQSKLPALSSSRHSGPTQKCLWAQGVSRYRPMGPVLCFLLPNRTRKNQSSFTQVGRGFHQASFRISWRLHGKIELHRTHPYIYIFVWIHFNKFHIVAHILHMHDHFFPQ